MRPANDRPGFEDKNRKRLPVVVFPFDAVALCRRVLA
jgi:hypothetical protein